MSSVPTSPQHVTPHCIPSHPASLQHDTFLHMYRITARHTICITSHPRSSQYATILHIYPITAHRSILLHSVFVQIVYYFLSHLLWAKDYRDALSSPNNTNIPPSCSGLWLYVFQELMHVHKMMADSYEQRLFLLFGKLFIKFSNVNLEKWVRNNALNG